MYNFISKTFSAALDPLTLAIVLLACAVAVRRRWPRALTSLTLAALLLVAVLGCPRVSDALIGSLEHRYSDKPASSYDTAQAIVVLGGAVQTPSGAHPASHIIRPSDRLLLALRLYRAAKAPTLVLSGGNNPLSGGRRQTSEADDMRLLLEEWGVPGSAIVVESGSINTRENASLSRQLLAPKGITKILLVSSAMHMPRAVGAFRKVGFEVIPAPADFRTGWGDRRAVDVWIPRARALAESAEAIREWLGVFTYRLRNWS